MTRLLSGATSPDDEPSLLTLAVNGDSRHALNHRRHSRTLPSYQTSSSETGSSQPSFGENVDKTAAEVDKGGVYIPSDSSPKEAPLEVEMRPLRPAGSDEDDVYNEMGDGLMIAKEETTVSSRFGSWLYPPEQPYELQLFRFSNSAIPACYLLVGILQGLSSVWLNVYPLDLGATEAQQVTLSTLRSLPASLKLLFGLVSDTAPVWGYRRKSYMLIGWSLASLSMIMLLSQSNVRLDAAEDERPSIPFLSLATLLFGTGFWWADVMADSLVAEKAKLEPTDQRGHLQSTCYACRFFGLMVAAPLSTWLYQSSAVGPKIIVSFMAILPLLILPLVYALRENQHGEVTPVSAQCNEIFKTVCSRAVWQPMGFVYLYNLLQVGNAAWREFLKTSLGFSSTQLNTILMVAYVLLYLGVMCYKYYLIHWSWRSVYVLTTWLNGLASLLQVLLIKGMTFGLSKFLFALGDDAFAEFLGGIQFLPTTIMMVHLCPAGSEGASYAMFTTVNNSALNLSSAISTQLLRIWDVSKAALQAGELSGMVNLTLLTTCLQVSGVLFVCWLPRTKEELQQLNEDSSRSRVGGIIFLGVTFSSILYAVIVGVLNVVKPGWQGES